MLIDYCELQERIKLHNKWLNYEEDGKRLVLNDVDLSCADLSHVKLCSADLSHVDLSNVNLMGADLRNVDFSFSKLYSSVLYEADLRCADLTGADLHGANLAKAKMNSSDLKQANLRYTDLSEAILIDADLIKADLYGADLNGADLEHSNLCGVNISDTERYRLGMVLKKSMIGWKKCREGKIVKLRIPKGSVVFCVNGKQCRSNKAIVISVNDSTKKTAISIKDRKFIYVPGKKLEVDDFDLCNTVECSTGIHFFKTREEAENYSL